MNRLVSQVRSLIATHQSLILSGSGLAGILISGLLVSQSFSASFNRYQAYRDAIVQLRALESDFNQEILKSRYELFASYDALVNNLNQQEAVQKQLSDIPKFINAQDQRKLTRLLEERHTALAQQKDLSEWFKSRNALLKNSLRYLPFLTEQLDTTFDISQVAQPAPPSTPSPAPDTNQANNNSTSVAGTTNSTPANTAIEVPTSTAEATTDQAVNTSSSVPQTTTDAIPAGAKPVVTSKLTPEQITTIRSNLNQLIRTLLLYNTSGEEKLAERAETITKRIADLENTLEIPAETLPTKVFRSHASVILSTKPLVEDLTDQLTRPLGNYTNNLETTLEHAYRQAGRRAFIFRILSLGWLLTMLGLANYIFVRRFRQQDPAFRRYQQQVDSLAETAAQLMAHQTQPSPLPQLHNLVERDDSLGRLARTLQKVNHEFQQNHQTAQEEAFVFLTVRLSLLTQNRRKLLLNAEAVDTVCAVLKATLVDHSCELLAPQFQADQVLLKFSYPPSISLPRLVKQLKQDTATALYSKVKDLDSTLQKSADIWSDSYLLVSCETPNQTSYGAILANQGEVL